jgi:ACR3 family arsenite transporter
MLLKIDFHALHEVRRHVRGIGVTLFVNWAVKPFSMALLAWLFIRTLFADMLPAGQVDSYIAGLILLASAPCTAMVFVWSNLTNGHPGFTLSQVALNDLIMVFAFAPIVALLLGMASITVPWDTLLFSVLLYIVLPVLLAGWWRWHVLARPLGIARLSQLAHVATAHDCIAAHPVLLFGFQGSRFEQPLVILLLATDVIQVASMPVCPTCRAAPVAHW